MKKTKAKSEDPDIQGSLPALRRAAKNALRLGLQTGTPVYVMEKGKILDLTKEKTRKQGK
ncbi:MAG: hypothetical protein JXB10_16250 [Pirellulales bacterium]|nr:hypothetical protein [Pirellulales bacterium]